MLHGLGYFIERTDDDVSPAPQELVKRDPRLAAVADYLDRGQLFKQYRGYSWCRFLCGAHDRTMGSSELTDGVWVWPEGLSHYLRFHSVALPEEFICHALRGIPPAPTPLETEEEAEVNFKLWIEWARGHRQEPLRSRLALAASAAVQRANEAWEAELRKVTTELGESPECCLFSDCSALALNGRAFCASHLPSGLGRSYHLSVATSSHLWEVLAAGTNAAG